MNRLCANISMLFTELPLLERFAAARDAGFAGVEILVPYGEPAQKLAQAAGNSSMPVVLINSPMGNLRQGGRGIAADPAAVDAFVTGIDQTVEYARELNVERVNVIAGRLLEGDDRKRHLATYRDNLERAVERLAPLGVRVDIEPVNPIDISGSLISRPEDALEMIERVDSGCVDLQFDVYHTARIGRDPVEAFHHFLPSIGHVQFSDTPGRHEPGSGELDFATIFAALNAPGYRGWFGAEYHPSVSTDASLGWLETWMQTVNDSREKTGS